MIFMNTITVLLSTYNGQKYLKEQIDSLLEQLDVDVTIIVRDDGSTDETRNILAEYKYKYNNVKIWLDANCGAEDSFNKLCQYAVEHYNSDYYAFCDQDDVWDRDKLKVALQHLSVFDESKPNLYFSNLKMVDEKLCYVRDLFGPDDVFIEKEKTLVQIFTYGCTCVFNRKALEDYCFIKHNTVFHDNWIYAICSYMGNVYYDPIGHIKYRQHQSNLSGSKVSGFSLIKQRIRRALKGNLGHDFENMARQLLFYQNRISQDDLLLIKRIANYRNDLKAKLFLLFSPNFGTGHFMKDLCIKYRILNNAL